jgi:hypothetical protein
VYLIQASLLLFGQQGFVISRNDKNKQLTLLSQGKLALTAIDKLFHYINIGAPKKLKTQHHPLVRPIYVNFCKILLNLSHETVPLSRKTESSIIVCLVRRFA